ncbi:MAG: type II toxin-antitoxin system VapC family toxin [Vulcanimicrobiaceae bacterium]
MSAKRGVVYWDSTALLSALFRDDHSEAAVSCAREPGAHIVSSLAWAESHAVIARLERERALACVLADAAREALDLGPWRRVNLAPDWRSLAELARRWPLRGADLWHLALAVRLRADLPELEMLTFDSKLSAAARGEGM